MDLFIALGLLIACGIVDAVFYNPRSQTLNQFMERRQRSIPIPYSYGYHYNPIEPSINVLDSLSEGLDSRINTFQPIYQNVKMSTHNVNSVSKTHSYQPKNILYDSEYISEQDIPSLFPEEDSVDYKYLGSPLNKYLTRPPTTESDTAINLVAIKKSSAFDYGFPTYKSRYSSDSVWNLGSKIPNTIFEDYQTVESDQNTFKVSSPTVTIVKLLPTLEQEPTITTKKNPYGFLLENLFRETQNMVKNSVKDDFYYAITQETPTEAEMNPITSEESQTVEQSNILELEKNPTKDESSFKTTEGTLTEDNSNSITIEETQTGDESNSLLSEKNPTENESDFITIGKNPTEDESNSITTEGTQTEDESKSLMSEKKPTENESDSITVEETQTEDESNSITTEETQTENELNSLVDNYTTTEQNQTEDDESKSTTSQETTTAFTLNYAFDENRYSESDKSIQSQINNHIKSYEQLRDLWMKSQFRIIDNITAKSQSNLSSDENTSQQLQPQLADSYEEY